MICEQDLNLFYQFNDLYANFDNDDTNYKTNYDKIDSNLSIEIVIYDEKYRKQLIEHLNIINNFPFYITYFLLIMKFFYYKLNIISNTTYKWVKKFIMKIYLKQELHDNLIAISL
jgi:hypothetical protein